LHKANLQVNPIEFEAGAVTRAVEAAKASACCELKATKVFLQLLAKIIRNQRCAFLLLLLLQNT
jgi:hypothetical protein